MPKYSTISFSMTLPWQMPPYVTVLIIYKASPAHVILIYSLNVTHHFSFSLAVVIE